MSTCKHHCLSPVHCTLPADYKTYCFSDCCWHAVTYRLHSLSVSTTTQFYHCYHSCEYNIRWSEGGDVLVSRCDYLDHPPSHPVDNYCYWYCYERDLCLAACSVTESRDVETTHLQDRLLYIACISIIIV